MKRLPIGIQSIQKILEEGYVYVDKTAFIKKLIDEGVPSYFMSRPRRFGKSLFLSTLEEIFKGNKELFKGCAIYDSDYDWAAYPVLRFDFSQIASQNSEEFKQSLKRTIAEYAKVNHILIETPTIQEGLKALITQLYENRNNKVVVLIDEYDNAIINNLKNLEIAEQNRDLLKAFFATLKSLDNYLKFTFVTGVSKFSQVSLFSGPNNLKDITMDSRYGTMMGYTQEEIQESFQEHIHSITKERKVSKDSVMDEMRSWYNGYRFSPAETFVYNPFSTLNYLDGKEAKPYWYSSGTPSFLIDELKKCPNVMVPLDSGTATEEELMDISRFDAIDLMALMYQTGYFTIQGYHPISRRYRLGLPNEEVRSALIHSLVQNFASIIKIRSSEDFVKALEKHHPECLFQHIDRGFASFAYQVFVDAKECTYQGMLLSMLYGMGFDPLSERATNTGRLDVVLELPSTIYILELKLDGSAAQALKQIQEQGYYKPYTHKGKHLVIIGANFSSKDRNISDWKGMLYASSGELLREIFPK